MRLETAQQISSKNVTEAELIEAFRDDQGRGEYIILSQSDRIYMQAAGEYDDPYTLEYREGRDDRHFQVDRAVSKAEVLAAFRKYYLQDESWKTDFTWKQLENKPWWKLW